MRDFTFGKTGAKNGCVRVCVRGKRVDVCPRVWCVDGRTYGRGCVCPAQSHNRLRM